MKKQIVAAALVGVLSFGLAGCAPSEEQVAEAVNEIVAGYDYEKSEAKYDEFKAHMSDEQIAQCDEAIHNQKNEALKLAGSDFALEYACDYVKARLKSPSSFTLYDSSSEWQYGFDENDDSEFAGSNSYKVEFIYGATNSFGGEVTDNARFYVPVRFDTESMSVSYDSTGVFQAVTY